MGFFLREGKGAPLGVRVHITYTAALPVPFDIKIGKLYVPAVEVRLDYPFVHWKYAAVIYTTNHNSPLDLAVLQLEGGVGVLSEAFWSTGKRTAKSYAQGNLDFLNTVSPERMIKGLKFKGQKRGGI